MRPDQSSLKTCICPALRRQRFGPQTFGMVARLKAALLGLLALGLAGCAGPQLKDYADKTPELDLVEYFTGEVTAWGQFQDLRGKVRRRFTVQIEGVWDGSVLELTEDFVYDDGETEQRIWRIQPDGNGGWTGAAAGVVGEATGEGAGNAFNWRYEFDLKTGEGETTRVTFDDWLWRHSDDVVFNKATVSKYGITLGEVVIFFLRDSD